ncbi:MAG TPA: DsrE family protein [Roseiarcus sp.]|nr:DsrE family protein [Roseiarcus sp.]
MERRGFFRALAAGGAGLMGLAGLSKAEAADKNKVVYHLDDLEKVPFVLGNIRNHITGTGGPGKTTIALVVHGPALKAFHAISAVAEVENPLADLHRDGVALEACVNTMRAQNVELSDLLPGFVRAEQGGVLRLAELQGQGYAYLRP